MKKLKHIAYLILCAGMLISTSCNENEFLKEEALDFYNPENSYITHENFQSALAGLYARVRSIHYRYNDVNHVHFYATDIAKNAREDGNRYGNLEAAFIPENGTFKYHWEQWYKVIADANTILSQIGNSKMTSEQQTKVGAEAKFFRGFAYRYLSYLYGGVPLVLEEVASPRADFVRASQTEVFNQVVADLEDAADVLPAINEVKDGQVSNLVASYYLAEMYISLGQYKEAINYVSKVIDDPFTSLMAERFGTRKNEPGDVYWDLFRRGNQNRSAGNNEALWVAQMEVDVPGGFLSTTGGYANGLERSCSPAIWSCRDPEGNIGFEGRKSDYNSAGRGVSFMANTDWLIYDAWGDDFDNDLRNSEYNFVRTAVFDLPGSPWFGHAVNDPENPSSNWKTQNWRWYPHPIKVTTPGNHPEPLYENPEKKLLKSNAGSTYRDMYYLRLAEAYLLRAEAHHLNGDNSSAAADINMVRNRVNATPVDAGTIDIDYILDERARELVYEVPRRITLVRTGKLVERVRKLNKFNGPQMQDHYDLFPIPYSVIEANKDAEIEQNPGYSD